MPTDRGVAFHDETGWHVVGAAEGLPTDWARDILEDREGSIWIASLGVGTVCKVSWCTCRETEVSR